MKSFLKFINQNWIYLTLLITSIATTGSLYFSEIAKFPPCNLCWYQRIFMYPQVILLFVAAMNNDYGVKKYIYPLSIIGFSIALYQVLLQTFPQALQCNDTLIPCEEKYTQYFGFISIPVMSAGAFLLIILLTAFGKSNSKK